jgi:hypothetical protein
MVIASYNRLSVCCKCKQHVVPQGEQKCEPVEGLEPPPTWLKAKRSDPLSYTGGGLTYCCVFIYTVSLLARYYGHQL